MKRDRGALVALGAVGALAALSAAGSRGGRGSRAGALQHTVRRLPFTVTYDLVRWEDHMEIPDVESGFVDEYGDMVRTDHLHGEEIQAELRDHDIEHEVDPEDEDTTADKLDVYEAWEAGLVQIPIIARLTVNLYDVANNFLPNAFSVEGGKLQETQSDDTEDGIVTRTLHPKPDVRRGLGGRKRVIPWPKWVLEYLKVQDNRSTHHYRRDEARKAVAEAKVEQIEAAMLGVTVAKLRELRAYGG